MTTKMFSVAVEIGGRVNSSLGGSISKTERAFSNLSGSLKKRAAETKLALSDMQHAAGLALSGIGLGHGIAHALGAGADFNKEVIALKNAGRTAQEVAQGIAKANATVVKLPTTTLAENLKLLNETIGAFGDFHHALENLDFNAKLSSVMQTSFGDKIGDPGEAFNQIVRAFEIRGTAADPEEYQHEMGKMYQAMAFTRGNVNPEQLLHFAQRANPSIRYLSEDFLTRIAPSLIQEFGGDQAGTGLSAFRKVVRGGISDSIQAKEWVKMGLITDGKVRHNKAGQVQGWASGAVEKTHLAFSDPLKWMEKVLLPKLQKKGIDINDEMALGKEFDVLFKNGRSNAFAGAIGQAKSRARLHKDAGLIDLVPTMDKAYENNMDDVKTGVIAVKNAFENLFTSLSGPLLAPASHALVALAMGVQRVAVALKAHPMLGAGLGIAGGAAAGVAGLTILRSSLAMLGLAGIAPIRLVKAELMSLGAMAAGSAAGGIRLLRATVLTLINPFRLVRVVALAARSAMLLSGVGAVVLGIAAAGTFIANNWNGIGRFFTEFGAAFTAALGPETTAKIQPIIAFGGRLLGIFKNVTDEISPDKWATWGTAAGKAAAEALKWVENLPGRLPALAGQFAAGMADLAKRGAKAMADYDWGGLGRTIVDGIVAGISSMGSALSNKLSSMAGGAWDAVKAKLGLGPAPAANDNDPSYPGRAIGGGVAGGKTYMVGEKGPELFTPGATGHVTTNRDLAALIRGSSGRLGINPNNLASVISYETAGTFDKWKAGPHTRWGQHRGFIQWGEPQARAAGIGPNSSAAEQMTAVEGYLRRAGVKPGSGLLDLYSAVNAGRVGRYGASDGYGTVASHTRNIMAAHGDALAHLEGRNRRLGFGRSHFGERGGNSGHPLRPGEVDPALTKMIARASEIMGVPLSTVSGYRDPAHNAAVGGARHSLHTQGRASDLSSPGHSKNDPAFWTKVNAAMRQASAEQAQSYRWGGNFGGKYLHDWNHFDIGQGGAGVAANAAVARAVGARARGYARAHFGMPRKPEGAPPLAPPIVPPPLGAMASARAGEASKTTHFTSGGISVEVNVNGGSGAPDEVGRMVAYEVRRVLASYEAQQRGMLSD